MREWARRAPNVAPGELARLARNAVEAVDGGFAGAVRGAVVADVVDTGARGCCTSTGSCPT